MAEGRFHCDRAATRRGHYQGPRIFVGGLGCERDCRYGALSHQRHAWRRLAQRGLMFGRQLRSGKGFDLFVSSAGARRQMGNRTECSDQRFQSRQDRQFGRGIKGRKIAGERVAREKYLNMTAVKPSVLESQWYYWLLGNAVLQFPNPQRR